MQGLGKPGVHQAQIAYTGMPKNVITGGADHMGPFANLTSQPYGDRLLKTHRGTPTAWGKQMIPKTLIEEAIKKGTVDFWGTGGHEEPTSDQYKKYTYPIEKEKGGTEIHMMWTDTPCRCTCWGCGADVMAAVRNPKIECIVAQHPWLENDVLSADIILPSNTTLEVNDISPCIREGDSFQSVVLMNQAIAPIGESRSDYEVVCAVAEKMGMLDQVTDGFSEEELIKGTYVGMKFDSVIPWEEFKEKQYCVLPVAPDWEKWPAGLYEFYKDPEGHPIPTPTGKLEFYSESLEKAFPTDEERPPIPKWIEKGITHDERISSTRAKAYPLLVMSNHGRWRTHAQCDDIPWTREALTCKVKGFDGYMYEPCWMNPSGRRSPGHQERRHRQGLQRARWGALRGSGVGTDHARGPLGRPRGPGRLHQTRLHPGSGRRHQRHRPRGTDLEARRRPGDQRLPGRGGAGQHGPDGGVDEGLSRGIRPRVRSRLWS